MSDHKFSSADPRRDDPDRQPAQAGDKALSDSAVPAGAPKTTSPPEIDGASTVASPVETAGVAGAVDAAGEEPADAELARRDAEALPDCSEELHEAEFSHPADVAEHLENLSLEKQVCLLSSLPVEEAAETLAELDEHVRVE